MKIDLHHLGRINLLVVFFFFSSQPYLKYEEYLLKDLFSLLGCVRILQVLGDSGNLTSAM